MKDNRIAVAVFSMLSAIIISSQAFSQPFSCTGSPLLQLPSHMMASSIVRGTVSRLNCNGNTIQIGLVKDEALTSSSFTQGGHIVNRTHITDFYSTVSQTHYFIYSPKASADSWAEIVVMDASKQVLGDIVISKGQLKDGLAQGNLAIKVLAVRALDDGTPVGVDIYVSDDQAKYNNGISSYCDCVSSSTGCYCDIKVPNSVGAYTAYAWVFAQDAGDAIPPNDLKTTSYGASVDNQTIWWCCDNGFGKPSGKCATGDVENVCRTNSTYWGGWSYYSEGECSSYCKTSEETSSSIVWPNIQISIPYGEISSGISYALNSIIQSIGSAESGLGQQIIAALFVFIAAMLVYKFRLSKKARISIVMRKLQEIKELEKEAAKKYYTKRMTRSTYNNIVKDFDEKRIRLEMELKKLKK